MFNPHKAITFGEEGHINRFRHGIVLIDRHTHQEGRDTDERLGHLRQILGGGAHSRRQGATFRKDQ